MADHSLLGSAGLGLLYAGVAICTGAAVGLSVARLLRRRWPVGPELHPEYMYAIRDLVHQGTSRSRVEGAAQYQRACLATAGANMLSYVDTTSAMLFDRWKLVGHSPHNLQDLIARFEVDIAECGFPDEQVLWAKFMARPRPHLLLRLVIKLADPDRMVRLSEY
jgi:hypothetical protein